MYKIDSYLTINGILDNKVATGSLNVAVQHIWPEQLTARSIELRKQWLNFSEEDEAIVKEVDGILAENIDPLIEDMYAHFLSFPETRAFFPDEATLQRAQQAQKRYFLRLTKGNYDEKYVAERLTVGFYSLQDWTWAHLVFGRLQQDFDLDAQLGAATLRHDPVRAQKVISSLSRLVFFDMGLAIESYSIAKEKAIREQQDAITELETEKRVTKDILEDAPSGIVRLDCNFVCLECNHEFIEMADLKSREQLVGQYLFAIIPGLPLSEFESVIETTMPVKRTAELLYLKPNREQGFFDWAIWPVKNDDGSVTSLVATFNDATTRVLLQQQREDFVATLTHDLKTPILAANRALKLFMDGDFGPIQESQKYILQTVLDSNQSMYKMVQTLLDVYRYDSGAKELACVTHDLSKTIATMVKELEPLAASRSLDLRSQLDDNYLPVVCDADAEIRRVIQNLLDNAMKFTPAGGSITIGMNQQDKRTTVWIKDTGRGISDADRPKLFQRFWAAASSGRYYASTGLGLYLCRKIVELHGGQIECKSTEGQGSMFSFTVFQEIEPSDKTENYE